MNELPLIECTNESIVKDRKSLAETLDQRHYIWTSKSKKKKNSYYSECWLIKVDSTKDQMKLCFAVIMKGYAFFHLQ